MKIRFTNPSISPVGIFAIGYSEALENSLLRNKEKAFNVQAQMTFTDAHKVGLNFWSGQTDVFKRTMLGAQGVFGLSKKLYILTEADHVTSLTKATSLEIKSVYELLKVGYEYYKGVHFQVVQEFAKPDLDLTGTETQSLGAGAIWYPRPHFELEGLWSKRRTLGATSDFEDYAYLLTHFYF